MLRTQRKSVFTLRKQNFKLKPCNHHIKGLPFFGPPLECCVNARPVFFIRFLCFFSWSGKLTYNRLNTRCSLGKEHSSKLHSSKTLRATVYVIKNQTKKNGGFMLSVSVITYGYKRTVSSDYEHLTTSRRSTFSLHHCHLFITLNYSWYLYRTFSFHCRLMGMWVLTLIQILQGYSGL